jgi:AraC-like DNA-binding protein
VIAGENWIEVEKQPNSMSIRLISGNLPEEARAPHTEYFALLLLKLLSWITGDDVHATEVRFSHPRLAEEGEYQRALQCSVRFQCPENTVLLSGAIASRPSLHANPEIAQIHQEFAEHQLAEFGEESVAHEVARHLASLLETGPCDLPTIAKRQNMSPRTLQRRLADENTTFQKILESLRRDLSLRHLKWAHVPLSEIAYLAGFADASSFNRAVRRWTGQTPLRYRQTHR